MTHDIPRGIRNHNPGNIRVNPAIMWRGQDGVDPEGFLIFDTPVHGIRAIAMIWRHYREYNHARALTDYISRWAPPLYNDTDAYIHYMAGHLNVSPNVLLNINDHAVDIVTGIITFENGEQPYARPLIEKGIHLSHIQ